MGRPGYYSGAAFAFGEGAKLAPGHPALPALPPAFSDKKMKQKSWHSRVCVLAMCDLEPHMSRTVLVLHMVLYAWDSAPKRADSGRLRLGQILG